MADPKLTSTISEISKYGFIIQSVVSLIAAGFIYYLRYLILKDVSEKVETERNYRIMDDKELGGKIESLGKKVSKVCSIVSGIKTSVKIHQQICPRMNAGGNGKKSS